jgi:hypothetical protein
LLHRKEYHSVYDISLNPNLNWEIIKNNLNYDWFWPAISQNPNINIKIIKNNPRIKWDWNMISQNSSITFEIIIENLDKSWNWNDVATNPNIKWKHIIDNWDIFKFTSWEYISINPNMDIVNSNDRNPWCGMCDILNNKYLDWTIKNNFTQFLIKFIINNDVRCSYYSDHPIINWEIICLNINKNWSWYRILKRKDITWEIIINNLDKFTNWECISANPNINWKIVSENRDLPWNWDQLSQHSNIGWNDIMNNLEFPWEWRFIFKRFDLVFDDILKILESNSNIYINTQHNIKYKIRYNWKYILGNPNLEWTDIYNNLNNINCRWDWEYISQNPNITWSIIKNNLDKPWDMENLAMNKFYHHEYFTSEHHKKKLVKRFLNNCWEELIASSCHPIRIFNWNEYGYLEFGLNEFDNCDYDNRYKLIDGKILLKNPKLLPYIEQKKYIKYRKNLIFGFYLIVNFVNFMKSKFAILKLK